MGESPHCMRNRSVPAQLGAVMAPGAKSIGRRYTASENTVPRSLKGGMKLE